MMKKKILVALIGTVLLLTALMLPLSAAIDWSSYPSSNLLYRYNGTPAGTINGLEITFQEDGSLSVSGTCTSSFVFYYCSYMPMEAGEYYFSYFGNDSIGVGLNVFPSSGSFFQTWGGAFSVSSAFSCTVYVSLEAGNSYDHTLYFMLNSGNVSYPYQPHIPSVIESAYDKGYVTLFEKCTFEADLTGSYPEGVSYKETFSFRPDFVYSGITFDSLAGQINYFLIHTVNDPYWDYVDRVTIRLIWDGEDVFDYRILPFYVSGDYDVNYGILTMVNGTTCVLNADAGSSSYKRQFVADSEALSLMTNKIEIRVGRPMDLLTEFTLYAPVESYSNGYSDGYDIGYVEGIDSGRLGAYHDGFVAGKAEGLSLGKSGTWTELMLAVTEAPINTFQSLFNFEILGMDMRVAFGSILTLCVILIVIKKVVL